MYVSVCIHIYVFNCMCKYICTCASICVVKTLAYTHEYMLKYMEFDNGIEFQHRVNTYALEVRYVCKWSGRQLLLY